MGGRSFNIASGAFEETLLYISFAEHLDSVRDPATSCAMGLHRRQPGRIPEYLELLGVQELVLELVLVQELVDRSLPLLRERGKNKTIGLGYSGKN